MSPHIYAAGGSGFSLWTRFCPGPWRKSRPLACDLKLSLVLVTALGPHVPPQAGAPLAPPEPSFQAGASERHLLCLHQNCTNVQEPGELGESLQKSTTTVSKGLDANTGTDDLENIYDVI